MPPFFTRQNVLRWIEDLEKPQMATHLDQQLRFLAREAQPVWKRLATDDDARIRLLAFRMLMEI